MNYTAICRPFSVTERYVTLIYHFMLKSVFCGDAGWRDDDNGCMMLLLCVC